MARPVEAVATNSILLVQLIRQRIHVRIVGHRLMESRIEHSHLRHARQRLLYRINTFQVSGVMQRSQLGALHNHLLHLRRDNHRLVELLAAVHHAVPHCLYLFQVFDAANLLVHQRVQNQLNTHRVLRHLFLDNHLLAVGQLHLQERIGQTDFLHAALCQHAMVSHLKQFILYTATSAVQYQYFHVF